MLCSEHETTGNIHQWFHAGHFPIIVYNLSSARYSLFNHRGIPCAEISFAHCNCPLILALVFVILPVAQTASLNRSTIVDLLIERYNICGVTKQTAKTAIIITTTGIKG